MVALKVAWDATNDATYQTNDKNETLSLAFGFRDLLIVDVKIRPAREVGAGRESHPGANG